MLLAGPVELFDNWRSEAGIEGAMVDVAAFDTAVAPPVVPAASSDMSSNGELVFIISCSPLKESLPSTLTAHPQTTHPN